MTATYPHFRSADGEAAYRAAYNRTLALWPEERESIIVQTRFGAAHVNRLGDPGAPALVMIHGFGVSATQWYPNAPVLARDYCVYAPDVADQLGLSQLDRPIQTPDQYAAWVGELLDGLGIARAPFIGHSYGGWMSTNFAIRCPQRVTRLSLIGPAATFVPLSWQFYLRGILGGATGKDTLIYSMMKWMTTIQEVRNMEIVEQFRIGLKNMAQMPVGYPTVFTEEELRSLKIPVQLIIGDHEVVYSKPPRKVVETAKRMIPHIQVAMIAGGGHMVTIDQTEATNQHLMSFHRLASGRDAVPEIKMQEGRPVLRTTLNHH